MTDLRERLQISLGDAYALTRELGGGGMSRVFVADELQLDRKVVIKVLSPDLAQGLSSERFQREIKLAASLQQANIVPVLATGYTGDLPYFTMPFVEGESLRLRLGRAPMAITETIGILRDVAKALAYAHGRGVVHRDIKPDNVLLSGGTAVVTDFGIAKAISASRNETETSGTLTQLGTSIGTPAYMAPEQAAGDPEIDHRADIYSFGCMAYELLTGAPPFAGRTPQRMLAAHMAEAPRHVSELRADTPPALADLVMRTLAKDAQDRPQTASSIVATIEGITSGEGFTSAPPILAASPGTLGRALAIYAVAFVLVAVFTKAAMTIVGLPSWAFSGALVVMALGLPVILVTGYVHSVSRRAYVATPTLTPGGTMQPTHGTIATMALKASPHISWRRTTLGGFYSLGAFVLLVGAFVTLRALGIGPFKTLFAAGTLKERAPILLTDFQTVNSPDTSLGGLVTDAVRAALSQSSVITLVGQQDVANTLRLMKRPPDARIEGTLAKEIAEREGYPVLIEGKIQGVGGAFLVTVNLVTADSGRELATFREQARAAADIIDVADKIARDVRERIGESLRSVRRTQPLAQVATSSIEALRKYSLGARANDVEVDYPKAVRLLREAVQIDTSFALAWRKLGLALANAGRPRSSIDSALTRAYQHRERLTEIEKLLVTAAYYANGPGRDRAKAIAAYEGVVALGDSSVLNNIALRYVARREFARAESAYKIVIRSGSRNAPLATGNLLNPLIAQGKFDEARRVVDEALTKYPTAGLNVARINLLFHGGRLADWERAVDSAYKVAPAAVKLRLETPRSLIQLLHGRLTPDRPSTAGPDDGPLPDGLGAVVGDANLRSWLLGTATDLRALDSAVASPAFTARAVVDRPYYNVAGTYARTGHPDRARAMLARAEAETKDTAVLRSRLADRSLIMGEILLAERKAREAMTAFWKGDSLPDGPANACTICLPLNLARAYDALDKPDSALAMYEKYLTTPTPAHYDNDPVFLAPINKRVGELYAIKGDTAKAIAAFERFIDLWKNADPELQPQVADARKKLQLLQSKARRDD